MPSLLVGNKAFCDICLVLFVPLRSTLLEDPAVRRSGGGHIPGPSTTFWTIVSGPFVKHVISDDRCSVFLRHQDLWWVLLSSYFPVTVEQRGVSRITVLKSFKILSPDKELLRWILIQFSLCDGKVAVVLSYRFHWKKEYSWQFCRHLQSGLSILRTVLWTL